MNQPKHERSLQSHQNLNWFHPPRRCRKILCPIYRILADNIKRRKDTNWHSLGRRYFLLKKSFLLHSVLRLFNQTVNRKWMKGLIGEKCSSNKSLLLLIFISDLHKTLTHNQNERRQKKLFLISLLFLEKYFLIYISICLLFILPPHL